VNTGQKEILDAVMRSIDRLARMISNLLDISSIETGKIKLLQKVTDLEPVVKDVIFEFNKRAGARGIELSMKPAGCVVRVLMDPDKITQVLSNLVDNAIKFTPEGGSL
jgi:signal transduction histidine kinase